MITVLVPKSAWKSFALATALGALASCSDSTPPGAATPEHRNEAAQPALIASVAASATEAMEDLGEQFHEQTGIEVKSNAGPSNGLATQILEGAPADVFLSASRQWADQLEANNRAVARVDLLTNRLVAVVPAGNPANVHAPEDLKSSSVAKVALAGENVPAGAYADQALARLGLVEANKVVRAQDVRGALSYVERGEAEAGVVYATDVRAANGVEAAFTFETSTHDEIVYVLVLVGESEAARELFDFLQSDQADETFRGLGFTPLGQAASTAK